MTDKQASGTHFDGLLSPHDRAPDGFSEVEAINGVFANPETGRLVLLGKPTAFHNCDEAGCGTIGHKIAEFSVDGELFYQDDHNPDDE